MKKYLTGCIAILMVFGVAFGQGDGDYQFSTTTKLSDHVESPFLSKGNTILNFNTAFSGEFGKNKFENSDNNTRKPTLLAWDVGFGAEKMVNDHLAVGGFVGAGIGVNKDKESDSKYQSTAILGGPMMTCYKPCGEAENGGIMTMGSLYGGIERSVEVFGDEKFKDPINGVIGANIDFGGFYQPTENLLFTATLGMIGWQTHFMPSGDDKVGPDMITTDFAFGWQDFDLNLGLRAVIGNRQE